MARGQYEIQAGDTFVPSDVRKQGRGWRTVDARMKAISVGFQLMAGSRFKRYVEPFNIVLDCPGNVRWNCERLLVCDK